jgi:hypothetical protein
MHAEGECAAPNYCCGGPNVLVVGSVKEFDIMVVVL